MGTENTERNDIYWLCPLYSFECQCERVNLAEGIQIKRAPNELKEYIHDKTYYLYGLWEDPSKFEWAAFLPYRRTKAEGLSIKQRLSVGFGEQERGSNSFVDLMTALRLSHAGRVLAGPLISATMCQSKWSVGGTSIWTRVSEKNFILEEPRYSFRKEDILEVNNLLQDIRKWRKAGTLDIVDIALRRFHSAYHGPIEDRIIDQMIAFESLYLGDSQELTYKLALRAAFLLGKRKDQRNGIFSDMKKAYSYRSRIVHGDNPPSRDELQDIVPKAEDYLRQSLRRFLLLLSEGHSLKEIRDDLLDQNIIKNGKLLIS